MAESAGLSVKIGADTSGLTKGAADVKKFGQVVGATAGAVAGDLNKASMAVDKFGKLASNGSKEAGYAFQSLGRVVSDLPFGPGGIANNLEVLPSAFRSLSAAAKESGQSIGGVLLKSLTGAGGLIFAFSAISAALSISQFGLDAWTRLMGKSKKETEDFAKSLKDAESGALSTGIKLKSFAAIASDSTLPLSQRNEALREANKLLGDHGEKLTLVNVGTKAVVEQINNYTNALVQQAIASKFADKVADLQIKQQEATQAYTKAINDQATAQKQLSEFNKERFSTDEELQGAYYTTQSAISRTNKAVYESAKAYREARAEVIKTEALLFNAQSSSTSLFGKVGFKGKDAGKEAESISKILDRLKSDREALARNPLIPDLDKPEQDIKLIEAAIKRLLELKVPSGSSIIEKLIGMEDFDKLIDANLKKNAGDALVNKPIEAPIAVAPKFYTYNIDKADEDYRQALLKRLQDSGIKNIATTGGIKIPITPFISTELLEQGNAQLKKSLESLGNTITGFVANTQGLILNGVGDALAQAFTGGDIGGAISGIFSGIGDAVAQLGQQMIALSPLIAGIKAAFSSLNPAGLLFGGIALIALGGALKNIVGKPKAFASGGIVSGPTNALVGEYPGARNNPEVIAPLNKLQGMLDASGGGAQVFIPELRLEGQDLLIAFRRAEKAYVR